MAAIINRFGLFIVLAVLIALGVTGNLFSLSPAVITGQLLALALSVWARRSFPGGSFRVDAAPAAAEIIRRGPYRFVRHPMYSAMLLFLWCGILSHSILWVVAAGILATVVILSRVVLEERVLREKYADYTAYTKSTKAIIPYIL